MTQEDMTKLWTLLASCRRGDPAIQDKNLRAAWSLVLEPYDYRDVREAVLAHFRQSKFFPDVGEITTRLPQLQPPLSPAAATRMAKDFAALNRFHERQEASRT